MKKEKQKLETNLWTLSIYQSIHKEIFNDINWNVYVWLTKQIKKKNFQNSVIVYVHCDDIMIKRTMQFIFW